MSISLKEHSEGRRVFCGFDTASVDDTRDQLVLWSYRTRVAALDKVTRQLEIYGEYSRSTWEHVREFARQQGFPEWNNLDWLREHLV